MAFCWPESKAIYLSGLLLKFSAQTSSHTLPAHVELWVLPGNIVHRVTWLERLSANLARLRTEIETAARDQVLMLLHCSR